MARKFRVRRAITNSLAALARRGSVDSTPLGIHQIIPGIRGVLIDLQPGVKLFFFIGSVK